MSECEKAFEEWYEFWISNIQTYDPSLKLYYKAAWSHCWLVQKEKIESLQSQNLLLVERVKELEEEIMVANEKNSGAMTRIEDLKGTLLYSIEHVKYNSRPLGRVLQVMEMSVLGYDMKDFLRSINDGAALKGDSLKEKE